MNCQVCDKEIEFIIDNALVDSEGMELLDEEVQILIKKQIHATYLDGISSKYLLEACSNNCYNKRFYSLLKDRLEDIKNMIVVEDMIGLNELMRQPRTEKQEQNINDMIDFVNKKIESFK